jgi:hypothetical protein
MFAAGANVAEEAENFFQSDRDLHLMAARKYKMKELGERGKPISLASKILHFELEGSIAYIAQSGFITQKIELPVIYNFTIVWRSPGDFYGPQRTSYMYYNCRSKAYFN